MYPSIFTNNISPELASYPYGKLAFLIGYPITIVALAKANVGK